MPLQGTQTDASFAASFKLNHATNVFATTQKTSCYSPEVPYSGSLAGTNGGQDDSYTGEDVGPYAGQSVTSPKLVNDHSESDLSVDPTNPNHLIGQTKWFVNAEGYNHLLGFYESFDGGKTWPVQGHIPGYEGFTDNTDPVGAFDSFANYHALLLPYQFSCSASGGHPQLNAPYWICICNPASFIGDYFGNTASSTTEYTTSVSTLDDGSNPHHYQQQVVASVPIPKP